MLQNAPNCSEEHAPEPPEHARSYATRHKTLHGMQSPRTPEVGPPWQILHTPIL